MTSSTPQSSAVAGDAGIGLLESVIQNSDTDTVSFTTFSLVLNTLGAASNLDANDVATLIDGVAPMLPMDIEAGSSISVVHTIDTAETDADYPAPPEHIELEATYTFDKEGVVESLVVLKTGLVGLDPVNHAPVISGTPDSTITFGQNYNFTPTYSDANPGDTLTFSATNLPSWASVDEDTGEITGMPLEADIGNNTGIVLTISDGTESTSLDPFDIEVLPEVLMPANLLIEASDGEPLLPYNIDAGNFGTALKIKITNTGGQAGTIALPENVRNDYDQDGTTDQLAASPAYNSGLFVNIGGTQTQTQNPFALNFNFSANIPIANTVLLDMSGNPLVLPAGASAEIEVVVILSSGESTPNDIALAIANIFGPEITFNSGTL